MYKALRTLVLLGALSVSTAGFAETRPVQAPAPAEAQTAITQTASHAVRGVVRSLDASSLVITRPAGKVGNLTFVLNPSTLRGGIITVGSTVSVRYRKEGSTFVATAVTAHTAQQVANAPQTAK